MTRYFYENLANRPISIRLQIQLNIYCERNMVNGILRNANAVHKNLQHEHHDFKKKPLIEHCMQAYGSSYGSTISVKI